MDFLGKKNQDSAKTEVPVEMHIPTNGQKLPEVVQEQPKSKVEEPESKSLEEEKDFDDQIDLSESERRKIRLKKLAKRFSLIVLVVLAVGLGGYSGLNWFLNRSPRVEIPKVPIVQEVPTTPITPVTPVIPPVINEPNGQEVLPDTALAPLRGSLIRLPGSTDIYLIENNGELRKVDQVTTVFENQQKVSDLSKSLIYTLPEKWSTIRRGVRDVTGQVDWDPRVLKISELLPFVQ